MTLTHGGIIFDTTRHSKDVNNTMISAALTTPSSGTKLRSPRRTRRTQCQSLSMEDKVKTWLSEAQEFVDQYKLSEAEQCFWQVLEWTSEDMRNMDRLIITALTGLSEVYQKRGRSMRSNELEWHRMYLYAVTSQQRAVDHCRLSLQWRHDNEMETWLLEQQNKNQAHLKSLEECLIGSLGNRLIQERGKHLTATFSDVDISYLDELQDFCRDKISRQIERYGSKENLYLLCQQEEEEEKKKKATQITTTTTTMVKTTKQEESPKKKKKINFSKVQEVIQNIVKQISSDMREREVQMHFQKGGYQSRYQKDMHQPGQRPDPQSGRTSYRAVFNKYSTPGSYHRRHYATPVQTYQQHKIAEEIERNQIYQRHVLSHDLTPSTTRQILSYGERISLMSPLTENKNLLEDLEEALNTDISEPALEPTVNYDVAGPKLPVDYGDEVKSSLDKLSPEKQQKQLELVLNQKKKWNGSMVGGQQAVVHCATKEEFTLACPKPLPKGFGGHGNCELRGNVIRGILTIWKAYDVKDSESRDGNEPPLTNTHHFFEEKSALTKVLCLSPETLANSPTFISNDNQLCDKLPVNERTLTLTTVQVLSHLGDQQMAKERYAQAYDVYKYALSLINGLILRSESVVRQLTHILHSMGLIKCNTGDIEAGMCLMERCVHIYEESGERDAEYKVARLWLDMGNLYMKQQWNDTSLFVQVMRIVRDEIGHEERQEELATDDVDSDDESDDGEDYWVSTQEAVSCYQMALNILRKLQQQHKYQCGKAEALPEELANLLVDVLAKLGDCSLSAGDYDKGVAYFEEVLGLFQNMLGSTALPTNAHVLSMLGTANFLLRNFPKAVAMYECAHILQQHLYGSEQVGQETLFILTMLGISFYSMKHHTKCISWCLKAYELHSSVFDRAMSSLDDLHKWFVTETLYSLGYSYSTLEFHEKSVQYLLLARRMLQSDENFDIKQLVKILKVIADVYTATNQDDKALKYYEEALQHSASLGDEESATTLKNQLLNRMAGVHVHNKQYNSAANYLEQALGYQKNVQNSIKDDLFAMQKQLATTYALSGDIDRALECYEDCIEDYDDLDNANPLDLAQIFSSQATLYHVKACIQDEVTDMLEYLHLADKQYRQAVQYSNGSEEAIQYANYLYQQEAYSDALLVLLPFIHRRAMDKLDLDTHLQYNGLEQAVLPEHLQQEIEDNDEIDINAHVFASFLAVLCYKQLGMASDADSCLVEIMNHVCRASKSGVTNLTIILNISMLAYAFLELHVYDEAARTFATASKLEPNNVNTYYNAMVCVGLWFYQTLLNGVYTMRKYVMKQQKKRKPRRRRPNAIGKFRHPAPTIPTSTPTSKKRDSGYYDIATPLVEEESPDKSYKIIYPSSPAKRSQSYSMSLSKESQTNKNSIKSSASTTFVSNTQESEHLSKSVNSTSYSSPNLITGSRRSSQFDKSPLSPASEEEWLFEEETIETPNEIINAMKGHDISQSEDILETARKRQQNVRSSTDNQLRDLIDTPQKEVIQEKWQTESIDESEDTAHSILDRLSKQMSSCDSEEVDVNGNSNATYDTKESPGTRERPRSIMKALEEAKSMMDDIQLMSSTLTKLDDVEAMSSTIEQEDQGEENRENTLDILQALADDIDKDLDAISARSQKKRKPSDDQKTPHDLLHSLKKKYASDSPSSTKSATNRDSLFNNTSSGDSDDGSNGSRGTSMLDTVRRRYSYHYGNTNDNDDTMSTSSNYDNTNGNDIPTNEPFYRTTHRSMSDYKPHANNNSPSQRLDRSISSTDRWSNSQSYSPNTSYDNQRADNQTDNYVTNSHRYGRGQSQHVDDDVNNIYDNLPNYNQHNGNHSYGHTESGHRSRSRSKEATSPEEVWQTWETEETVDTPPELLAYLQANARK